MNKPFHYYLVFLTFLCCTHLDAKPTQADSNSTALKYQENETEVDGDQQKHKQQEFVKEMAIDQNVSDVKINVPPDGASADGGGDGVSENIANGPKTVAESMHGVLMHGDKTPGKDHSHEHGAPSDNVATNIKAGPQDIEQQLHGVLMHGDKTPGKDHSHEHGASSDNVATNIKAGPQDIEQQLHGVLMHGDDAPGKDHSHEHEALQITVPQKTKAGPLPIEQQMHADNQAGLLHHTKDDIKESIHPKFRDKIGAKDYEDYLHGVMMHGDSEPGKDHHSHSDEVKNTDDNNKIEATEYKPMDYEEYLHGVLMHNDVKPGESHVHEDQKKLQKIHETNKVASPSDAAEVIHGILMHGDDPGYKHHEHDKNKESDRLLQPGSVLGPDIEALDASLTNNNEASNPAQFVKRKIEVKSEKTKDLEENVKDVEENRISGYLYSIYKTIHDMKEKYLNPDRNNNNNHNARRNQKTKEASEEGVGVITAEEARQHVSPVHEHKSGDMRSDLELIGNTAPLHKNYRIHKDDGKKRKHDEG